MASFTRSAFLAATIRRTSIRPPTALSSSRLQQHRLAHSDYGSGDGSPVGENPQDQGANPSADKEHPGPPPPKAGQGSGGSPTKGTSDGHNTQSAHQDSSSSSKQQKRQFSSMRTLWAEKKPKSTDGLSPKILDESPPTGKEESEDVKEHNRDFENRTDRASQGIANEDADKDKVSSKFWSGKKTEEKVNPKD